MDAGKKKELASKVAQRRAASLTKLKKSGAFKAYAKQHEGRTEPPRKLARA
jgi:hypothetical protein